MSRILSLLAVTALLAACTGASPSPSPVPSNTPFPSGSAGRLPSQPADGDLYIRAWYAQALPPEHTFSWTPSITVADGLLLDGNVALPAIFPGPMMIAPNSRAISAAGISALVGLAQQLGMLGDRTDFTGGDVAPGSRLGQIEMAMEGGRRMLVGNPDLAVSCDGRICAVDPGTPDAFAAFWQQLSNAGTWLDSELGATNPYVPARVALLLTQPPVAEPGMPLTPVAWPLSTSLNDSGVEFPSAPELRCLTVAGADLQVLLPILQRATQLTVFVDDVDNVRSAEVRVLVPRETSPCPD